jgi:hypothetical protein
VEELRLKPIKPVILGLMKEIISLIAIGLTLVAYVSYCRDIIKGKTHPHIYSWILWGVLTALIAALQIKGGAGPSAWITIVAGLQCLIVVGLSLKHGKKDITLSDTLVAILSLVAMCFWLFGDQPMVSIVLAVIADLLAFIPTVRKSWNKPYSETLSLYATNTVRFVLAVIAVQEYSFLAILWPASWAVANGLFALMLVERRKKIKPA